MVTRNKIEFSHNTFIASLSGHSRVPVLNKKVEEKVQMGINSRGKYFWLCISVQTGNVTLYVCFAEAKDRKASQSLQRAEWFDLNVNPNIMRMFNSNPLHFHFSRTLWEDFPERHDSQFLKSHVASVNLNLFKLRRFPLQCWISLLRFAVWSRKKCPTGKTSSFTKWNISHLKKMKFSNYSREVRTRKMWKLDSCPSWVWGWLRKLNGQAWHSAPNLLGLIHKNKICSKLVWGRGNVCVCLCVASVCSRLLNE